MCCVYCGCTYPACLVTWLTNLFYGGTQYMGPQYAMLFMSLFCHLQLSSGSYIILKFVDTSPLLTWLATYNHFIQTHSRHYFLPIHEIVSHVTQKEQLHSSQRQYHEHSHIMWFWLLQTSQFLRKRNKFHENWQTAEVLLMQHIQDQM
jgi:hypothetical protein